MITVWLDYAKAFDSVSHSWLFTAMRLVRLPENIVISIEKTSKLWATIVTLKGTNQTVKTDIITYFKEYSKVSKSFIVYDKTLRGYGAGKDCKTNITYNFFVDDLKLNNSTTNRIKKQLHHVLDFPKISA